MKQEEKSLIARNKIISAAAKLFSEKGYDETTMQDIMQISGLSKGAIYHYFKSKQEILDYISNYEKEMVSNYLRELVDDKELTAKEKIERAITCLSANETLPELT
ncbi:MAG: helix-turn-helix domain containing protein, partial [Lachnospiraceae bacterium]|nr:helix-turn-helix domain containing protein [Lachnospiraceae bacterium]